MNILIEILVSNLQHLSKCGMEKARRPPPPQARAPSGTAAAPGTPGEPTARANARITPLPFLKLNNKRKCLACVYHWSILKLCILGYLQTLLFEGAAERPLQFE